MAVPTLGAQGGYTAVTQIISAAGQTAVLAELAKLTALLVNVDGTTSRSPDFADIPKHVASKIAVEIAALAVAIDAAPVS